MTLFRKAVITAAIVLLPAVAGASTITVGGTAADLINALTAPGTGLTITSLTISGHTAGAGIASWGTYTNPAGTYGMGPGIVISSGDVADYGAGPNTSGSNTTAFGVGATAAQEATLDLISGPKDYRDVTEIDIVFDMDALHDTVFFNVVFGSEEYAEFVGSTFIDAFGMLVNGTNVAFVGGLPVNVDHPNMAVIGGTELDGVLAPGGNPVVTFSHIVGAGTTGNTLKFIIADSGDFALDSVAYIGSLGGEPTQTGDVVPEPATLLLLGSGLALLARRRLAKRA